MERRRIVYHIVDVNSSYALLQNCLVAAWCFSRLAYYK